NSVNVVYNSLDYKRMNSVMDEHEKISCQSIKKPYIIFSGRIIKERKLEILFEALYILQSNGVELKAVIIGDGPYLPFIKNLATKYSLVDSVDFVGSCYDENIIYSYYKSAVACVFPGPVGLTAIHSLTYGIPIITNDNMMKHKPEVEAVKEGTTGFYFKDNNVHSLVDVLKHVLSINDNDLRIIANNAKGIIKNKYNPIYQSGVFNRSLYKKT
ncbi:MAG: glycosyltransferase, partial [Candidatus Paceibacterota bacterium]